MRRYLTFAVVSDTVVTESREEGKSREKAN